MLTITIERWEEPAKAPNVNVAPAGNHCGGISPFAPETPPDARPAQDAITAAAAIIQKTSSTEQKFGQPSSQKIMDSAVQLDCALGLGAERPPLARLPSQAGLLPNIFLLTEKSPFMSEEDRLRTPRVVVDPLEKPERQPLRKLKLSLKLPQLHKLYLTSNISPKLVRFAAHLENVKTFNGKDSPLAVSAHTTPVGSPCFDFGIDTDSVEDYFSRTQSLALDSEDSSDDDAWFSNAAHKYKVSYSNFASPQNLFSNVSRPVYLHNLGFSADKSQLEVSVMCANWAFEKHVALKMTFNDWQLSVICNNALYVKLFPLVNFDQFMFTIPLTNLPSAINIQFCIKYSVAGQTLWDNNASRNYSVGLAHSDSPKAPIKKSMNLNFAGAKVSSEKPVKASNTEPASNAFAPTVQRAKDSVSYNDLVNRLMKVKSDTRPRTKYSKSFLAKETSLKSPTPKEPASKNYRNYTTSPPPRVQSFENTAFNSNSYATLLRQFCFNGTSPHAESPSSPASPSPAAISAGVGSGAGTGFI